MYQHTFDWLAGISLFRKNDPRMSFRTRLHCPLAAEVEFLENRALLSITLGTATGFAVLGGSAVTNTGGSAISGNVGVSPGGAVAGFAAGQVTNGTIHVNDSLAVQAHSDAATAYNALAGEAVTTVLTGQNLGGLTLAPGVYFFSSSALLSSKLTLDAQGDPNALFVFQIGSTLTTATSSSVVMIGGGNPTNVYWQIGSSATLGTGTAFEGNLIALTSITVTTGSSINGGRALAINGAVTLDDNAISNFNALLSLSGLDSSQYFVQGTPHLPFVTNLIVSQTDGVNVLSGTVSFLNWQDGDRITFYNSFALQHTFAEDLVNHSAVLTLTGAGAASNYQTTLQTLLFFNVAGQPNPAVTRIASITLSDQFNTTSVTEDLGVFKYLDGPNADLNYLQGSAPLLLAPTLVVTPPAGVTMITNAIVSFVNWQGEDRVAFYNTLALQHTFTEDLVAHTSTLTITGNATAAGYQTLLRSVTYQDVAGQPNTFAIRVATLTVNDGTNTVSANEHLSVTATNQPPLVLVNDSAALTYQVNSAAVAIMSQSLVSDPDSNNLSSLSVQIQSFAYQIGHDLLSFANQSGITGSFNATTGTLTLSGSSYVGNYREALRTVMFQTTGSGVSTATRTFLVVATDNSSVSSASAIRNVTITP